MSTTMPETTISEADRYLKEVAPYLAAVPQEERADLLEDLAQHLREIEAEPGPPLAERLGSPEAYATELLASAGVAAARGDRRGALKAKADRLASRSRASLVGREVTRLWPIVQPAWWIARAYLAVSLLATTLSHESYPGFPFPRLLGSPAFGVIAFVIAIPLSVRLGQRRFTGFRRWGVFAATAVFAVYAVVLLRQSSGHQGTQIEVVNGPQATGDPSCLTNASGQNITNLYAYSPDGTLLDPVLLYDQDGQPINNLCPEVDDQGRPLTTTYGKDVNGAPVINAFPRRQSVVLQPGVSSPGPGTSDQPAITAPVNPPAVVVPRLAPTSTTTTALPTATAGSSASTTTSVPTG